MKKKTTENASSQTEITTGSFIHWDLRERLEELVSSTRNLLASVNAAIKTSRAIVSATQKQTDHTARQPESSDS